MMMQPIGHRCHARTEVWTVGASYYLHLFADPKP